MSNLITTQINELATRSKTGPKPMLRSVCVAEGCNCIADHPVQMLCGVHYKRNQRTGSFESSRRDRGTGTITTFGYIAIAKNGKKKQEHVLLVESVLGHELPTGTEIHHVDGDRSNNANRNLVVCPSKAYHKMLHTRQDALAACGNAGYRKCPFCKQYSAPESMTHNKSSRYFYHSACKTSYNQKRKQS